jgi:hypothetical protein
VVIFRVLTKAAICGILWLSVSSVIQAADHRAKFDSKPLDIRVQPNGFGRANPADITAVLQSAGSELWRYCPGIQLGGIDVYHRIDHPQTDFKRTASGRIAIGLACQNTNWAQYSFQFGHEFCHALANFGNRPRQLVRYPFNVNLWLEESLCETASLFALRAMSRSWETAPPYPPWRDYAPWLNVYAEQRLAMPEHHLPAGTPFLVWFRENQSALRQNPALRDRDTIIAIRLLPIFESDPRGWEALAFLNGNSPNSNKSLAEHFDQWRSRCPKYLRPFVIRLAAVFAVRNGG